jgi:hypothetical protein
MKKVFLLFAFLCGVNAHAANIYVNNSGQSGTYTTISAAITAAAAGDIIYVSPFGVYSENLTITKSLTITSAVSGTRFSVVGTVTITSAPNQDVIIIGGEFSSSINANTGTATLASKGLVTLSDCKSSQITTADFIKSKVLFSKITGTIGIRHGKIIGSEANTIIVYDGPNAGVGDTIFIIGNKILSSGQSINWNNNDNYFFIANNYVYTGCLVIYNFQYNSTIKNTILNNTFNSNYYNYGNCLRLAGFANANMSNIEVYNNLFFSNTTPNDDIGCGASTCSTFTGTAKFNNNIYEGNLGSVGEAVVGNVITTTTFTIDSFGKSTDALIVNQGSPALQYYDIDLTRNDIGTYGGPYSIDNYWNTAAGRARVYDLTIPFEIWNGSTPSIKAEGTHIK